MKLNVSSANVSRFSPLSTTELQLLQSTMKQILTSQTHLQAMEFLKDPLETERLNEKFSGMAPMGQVFSALNY
jgi:hypothetical protein